MSGEQKRALISELREPVEHGLNRTGTTSLLDLDEQQRAGALDRSNRATQDLELSPFDVDLHRVHSLEPEGIERAHRNTNRLAGIR